MKHPTKTHLAWATLWLTACSGELPEAVEAETTTDEVYARNDLGTRWPSNVVQYTYYSGSDADKVLPADVVGAVEQAVDALEARVPLQFIQVPSGSGDYILFQREPDTNGGSHAKNGTGGGKSVVHLTDNAGVRTAIHEVGHILGLRHEHQRPDRDDYVTVIHANIADKAHNFEIKDPNDHSKLTPYDHQSVMHYGTNLFCTPVWDYTVTPPQFVCETTTSLTTEGYVTTNQTLKARAGVDTAPDVPGTQTAIATNNLPTKHDINALWLMYAEPLSTPLPNEDMGAAMVVADFDQDGYDDIAVGVPGEAGPGSTTFGAVFVYKGTARTPVPWRVLRYADVGGLHGNDDRFGAALAVGDFDGDQFPDLAVGAPGALSPFGIASGTVSIFGGGQFAQANMQPQATDTNCPTCVDSDYEPLTPWRILSGSSISGVAEASGDWFGAALATGDGNGNGTDELIVGAPRASSGFGTGRAYFFIGDTLDPSGTALGAPLDVSGLGGTAPFTLGAAVTTGDFDGDGNADVAIAAPAYGREHVYVFCGGGLQYFQPHQHITPPTSNSEFGFSMTTGNVRGKFESTDELIIGAPRYRSGNAEVGRVLVYQKIFGSGCTVFAAGDAHGSVDGGRYGHAVLAADIDADGDDDIIVGAPFDGDGRVERVLVTTWNVSNGPDLLTVSNAKRFGMPLASGWVHIDPLVAGVGGVYGAERMRLFVGAPESLTPTALGLNLPGGAVYGYVVDGNTTLLRQQLHQGMDSPFSR